MGIFSKELNSLEDLFWFELGDLYDAESRLVESIPTMEEAAHSPALKSAFNKHLNQTKRQLSRLEQIFVQLGKPMKRETCQAMKGLISEGEEIISATGDPDVKDAALISAAQRIEHYEMAGYGTVRTFAEHLGHEDASRLLQMTLDEEKDTDKELTSLAEQHINYKAEWTENK